MLRASLSSADRSRRCTDNMTICCQWLARNNRSSVQSNRRAALMHIPSSAINARYSSVSRRNYVRPRSSLVNPTTTEKHQKFYSGSKRILFSTKPSYDYDDDYMDKDYDNENSDGDDSELRWIKRSPSGFDNFSRYDNHYQPSRRGGRYTNNSMNSYDEEEESLINLLNDNTKPQIDSGASRDKNFMSSVPHRDDRMYHGEGEDSSLLNLLSSNFEEETAEDPSTQFNSYNADGEAYLHQDRQQSSEDDSLLNLLGSRPPSSSFPIATEHSSSEENEDSLLNLLSNQTTSSLPTLDHESPDDNNSLLNLLDTQSSSTSTFLNTVEKSSEDSLMNLLDGEQTSSSFPTLNGYHDEQFQQRQHQFLNDEPDESLHNLLNETTPDIDAKTTKYKDLNRIQLQLELESTEEAMSKILETWNSARARSDYETLPIVKRTLDTWYLPLTEAIEREQWLYLNNDYTTANDAHLEEKDNDHNKKGMANRNEDEQGGGQKRHVRDRSRYGQLLCLLPPRKIAVILTHYALQASLTDREGKVKVVSLAMYIAQALEMEVNVSRALRIRAKERKMRLNNLNSSDEGEDQNVDIIGGIQSDNSNFGEDIAIDNWVYTATHLQRFMDELSRTNDDQKGKSLKGIGRVRPDKVQRKCKEILLAEGYVSSGSAGSSGDSTNEEQTQTHDFADWDPVEKVKLGCALVRLLLDNTTFRHQSEPEPAFYYLRQISTGNAFGKSSGYIGVHPDLHSIAVKDDFASTSSLLSPSFAANARVQPMVIPPTEWTDANNGGYETIKVPFMRTRHCKTQKESLQKADLSKVMEGLNMLGNIPWKINQKVLDAAWKCWNEGIVLGDIPPRTDYDVPPLPPKMEYKDYKTLGDLEVQDELKAYRKYRERVSKHNRWKQKNMDLHSLRCSAMLKLNQANKFQDFEEIFFPYNVDFRGRAYPVPPHLSIVGSDLCRALLVFANPKPLGKNGLYWLKVHLANLAGADKMPFDGRAQFADDNMDNIRDTVKDPFGENDWWKKFDDPFQGLATCHEIVNAIDSGDPENYMGNLPVHMDGSCNGLQHYAALGRDKGGGKAVNLCIADKPQDVYIGVMHEVVKRVATDANEMIPFDEDKSDLTKGEKELLKKIKSARLVNGLIDRGVVKRTVMTSVYGVTYIGAKNQISEKIEEKLEAKGYDIHEKEPEIHMACGYLASLTMEVMGQQFKGARQTMNWLTECARLISSQGQPVAFVSPIGVPVVQPYRQRRPFTVVTLLQNITLTNDSDVLPLHRTRQVSAFPPNYVHSLDSSHMLLTAIEMKKRGLHFSAVHDSFWTHPCDIEEMNAVLREAFIDLYNQPLLEDLRQSWQMRYPSIEFPEIPTEGDLDLNDVRSAPYFFQ